MDHFITISSGSSSHSGHSFQSRPKCSACGKPPTTAFSGPLKKCTCCHRLFHSDCQVRASPCKTGWICSACTRRKRRTESSSIATNESSSLESPPKKQKVTRKLSEDENSALNKVIAAARQDPELENIVREAEDIPGSAFEAFKALFNRASADIRKGHEVANTDVQHTSHNLKPIPNSSFLNGQSKELSPPYSPQRPAENAEHEPTTSDVGVQVGIEEKPGPIMRGGVTDEDSSMDGIPLGDSAEIDDFVPIRRFPCSQCRRSVITNPIATRCSACMNDDVRLPTKNHYAIQPQIDTGNPPPLVAVPNQKSHDDIVLVDLISYGSDDGEKYPAGAGSSKGGQCENVTQNLRGEIGKEPQTIDSMSGESFNSKDYREDDQSKEMRVRESRYALHKEPAKPARPVDLMPTGSDADNEALDEIALAQIYGRPYPSPHDVWPANAVADKVSLWQRDVPDHLNDVDFPAYVAPLSWSGRLSNREREDEKTIPEELLHKKLRRSNQVIEDLKVKMKHLEDQIKNSDKEHKKVLVEKEDKMTQLSKSLEEDRRVGQRRIQKLEQENKELLRKQRYTQPDNILLDRQDDRFHQLEQEYHALRKSRTQWQSDKSDLERQNSRLDHALKLQQNQYDVQKERNVTLEKENKGLRKELAELRSNAPESRQQDESARRELDGKCVARNAGNACLEQEIAELEAQTAGKAGETPFSSHVETIEAGPSNVLGKSAAEPDLSRTQVCGCVPVHPFFRDWLDRHDYRGSAADEDTKSFEIEERPLKKQKTTQICKVHSNHLHKKSTRSRPRSANWDEESNSGGSSRRMRAVEVPRHKPISSDRSSYSPHVFPGDQYGSPNTMRVASGAQHHQQRTDVPRVIIEDADSCVDESYTSSSSSSTDQSSSPFGGSGARNAHDPIDLSTRGAPLNSSLGQVTNFNDRSQHRARIINEDPDASPPPPISRNERSMQTLYQAVGLPNEFRPVAREGKLWMEEVRGDEEENEFGRKRRPKRLNAWPVGY